MEKGKLEMILIEKNVAMKASKWSLVDQERNLIYLETGKHVFVRTNEEFHFLLFVEGYERLSDSR